MERIGEMKCIFYTNIDKCIDNFVSINTSMMDLSENHTLFLLSSGYKEEELKEKYPNAIIIITDNVFVEKYNALYDYITKHNIEFDWLIRLDMDMVIYDVEKNINILKEYNPNEKLYIGRWHTTWIKGAFNALSKASYNAIPKPYNPKDPRWYNPKDPRSVIGYNWIDHINTQEPIKAGCKIIKLQPDHPTGGFFQICHQITNPPETYAVVHPQKGNDKFKKFVDLIEVYNKKVRNLK